VDLETEVYEVSVEADPPEPPSPEPSLNSVTFVAWVAPSRGWWRTEHEDATGFETTEVYARGSLMKDHNDGPPEVRIGSAEFVGIPSTKSFLVDPLRANHPLSVGDEVASGSPAEGDYSLIVRDRIELTEAVRRGLFTISTQGANINREVEPGKPSSLVRAYWFGRLVAGLEAVRAVEIRRLDEQTDLHQTFYAKKDTPSVLTGGSALLTVASQPIEQPFARKRIEQLSKGERTDITLANGEGAALFDAGGEAGYLVITKTTVVSFVLSTPGDPVRLAGSLRPL
jgi:hypothetical protein